jgi:Omp85 superfamily domain
MYRALGAFMAIAILVAPVAADDDTLADQATAWIDRNPRRLVRKLNEVGLYPSLGSVAEGGGSGPGLAYFRPEVAGTPLDLYLGGAWSFKGDSGLSLRIGRVPYVPNHGPSRRNLEALTPSLVDRSNARPFFAYFEARRDNLANESVFGPEGDGELPFVYQNESYDLVAGYRVAPRLVASLRAGYLETHATLDLAADSPLSALDGVGTLGRDLSFQTTTASLAYDHRDHPRDPRRGSYVEASLARYAQRGPGSSSFDRFTLDARQYVPLGSERHVLAFRGLLGLDATGVGQDVPFFLERSLGGSRTLRSFAPYRFRGPRLATFSAEYRYQVKGPFEVAAFYDGGKVWGGPEALGTHGLASSYGLGVRIKSRDDVLIRLDLGHGSEGTRANVSFGYSF